MLLQGQDVTFVVIPKAVGARIGDDALGPVRVLPREQRLCIEDDDVVWQPLVRIEQVAPYKDIRGGFCHNGATDGADMAKLDEGETDQIDKFVECLIMVVSIWSDHEDVEHQ